MLIPSSVPPRTTELSETQHCELGQYFERHVEHDAHAREPLQFALVLAGDKPAADLSPSDWAFPDHPFAAYEGFLALCDLFDLSYRRIGSGVGNDWFIAPSPGRLDLLPSTNRTDHNAAWHRRLGVILGYPPEAIEFFIETSGQERTQPYDLVAAGVFTPEEVAYTRFVFYIHDDSIDGYEQAIKTGKAVRERFEELATEWDLPALDTLAEGVYDDAIRVFAARADGQPESFRTVG